MEGSLGRKSIHKKAGKVKNGVNILFTVTEEDKKQGRNGEKGECEDESTSHWQRWRTRGGMMRSDSEKCNLKLGSGDRVKRSLFSAMKKKYKR